MKPRRLSRPNRHNRPGRERGRGETQGQQSPWGWVDGGWGGVLACKKYADRGATAVVSGAALAVHGWVAEWVPRKTQGGEKQAKEDGEEGTEGGGRGERSALSTQSR